MAGYNEILSGRFNRLLEKLLSMKGPPPAPTLAGDIMAVLPFFQGVENRYLEGWNRFGQSINQLAGIAGTFTKIRFRNPTGSNIVVVIEKLAVQLASADTVNLTIGNANTFPGELGTLQNVITNRLDARSGVTVSSNLRISSEGTVAGISGVGVWIAFTVAAALPILDLIFDENQELTLLPGDAYQLTTNANTQLLASLFWRERLLEDSERA